MPVPAASTSIEVPESHPILGLDVMLPMVLHHPGTIFDEENLLKLLRSSYSLSLKEKLEILAQIPRMNQDQINNLFRLLVDEHEKFEFIADEYPEDVAALVDQRVSEMVEALGNRVLMNN